MKFSAVLLEDCPYSEKAYNSIKENCDHYELLWVNQKDESKEILSQYTDGYGKFPVIFIDGEFIGGFSELQNKL